MIGLPSNIPCLGVRSDMLMGPQSSSRISHADNPCFSEYQIKVTGMRFQIGSIIKVLEWICFWYDWVGILEYGQ